jgi:ribosome maturation factor RimP
MKQENVNKKEILANINPIIEHIAAKLDLTVLEINFVKESGNWHLRIFIYSSKHPISHQDCENITKGLGDYLDELIPVQYYLEVSSPGTDRKLKSPKEYNIFKGKKVEVKLKGPTEENLKNFQAKILEYTPDHKLKVEVLDNNKILSLEDKNISTIRLIHEND